MLMSCTPTLCDYAWVARAYTDSDGYCDTPAGGLRLRVRGAQKATARQEVAE